MERQTQMVADRIKNSECLQKNETQKEYLSFFEQLAQARKKAGLTQEEVAQRMGTTATVVARLESGGGKKRHSPTVATLRKYARAVGCQLKISLSPAAQ